MKKQYLLTMKIYDSWWGNTEIITERFSTKKMASSTFKRYKEHTFKLGGIKILEHSISKVLR